MGRFHYDENGYPRWNDSNKLVHKTVARTPAGMVTHHKDGNKKNFRHGNLQNMSRSGHSRLHAKKRSSYW